MPYGRANRRYVDALDQIFGGLQRDIGDTGRTLRRAFEIQRHQEREQGETDFIQQQVGRLLEATRDPSVEMQRVTDMPALDTETPLLPRGESPLARRPRGTMSWLPGPTMSPARQDPRGTAEPMPERRIRDDRRSPEEINQMIEQAQLALIGRGTERAAQVAPLLDAFRRQPGEERQFRNIDEVVLDRTLPEDERRQIIDRHLDFERERAALEPGSERVLRTEERDGIMLVYHGKEGREGEEIVTNIKRIDLTTPQARGGTAGRDAERAAAEFERWDSEVQTLEGNYGEDNLQRMIDNISDPLPDPEEWDELTSNQKLDVLDEISTLIATERQIVRQYLDALAKREAARRAIERGGGTVESYQDEIDWPDRGPREQQFPDAAGQDRPSRFRYEWVDPQPPGMGEGTR